MGNRANTVLWTKDSNGRIETSPAIYTHWSEDLQVGIKKLKDYYESNKDKDAGWHVEYRLEIPRVFPKLVNILTMMGMNPQVEMFEWNKDARDLPTANDMRTIADDQGLHLIEIPSFEVTNSEYKHDRRMDLDYSLNLLFEPNGVDFYSVILDKDNGTDFDLEENYKLLNEHIKAEINSWLGDLGIEVKLELKKAHRGRNDITDKFN